MWLKVDGDLPDDPLLHVCLMTYASDMTLLDTVLLNHGLAWGDKRTMGASLDHAMWFHRPFRADDWLLYYQDTPFVGRRPAASRAARCSPGRGTGRLRHAGGSRAGLGRAEALSEASRELRRWRGGAGSLGKG